MSKLEILCTTMHQTNFSKIKEMNIHSNVVFANQSNRTSYDEEKFDGHLARMITTTTIGVGVNRNLSLIYSNGSILLLADDDIVYYDNLEEIITTEFDSHPDADVFIFNIATNSSKRPQVQNKRTRKIKYYNRLPYGAPRIAIRKSSWEKSNTWFTTLFGGGAKYSSGEDSIFLNELRRKGLKMYVSKQMIGIINMDSSSWFHGRDSEYYFNKGAFCAAVHPHSIVFWKFYYCIRIKSDLDLKERLKNFQSGVVAYGTFTSFSRDQ